MLQLLLDSRSFSNGQNRYFLREKKYYWFFPTIWKKISSIKRGLLTYLPVGEILRLQTCLCHSLQHTDTSLHHPLEQWRSSGCHLELRKSWKRKKRMVDEEEKAAAAKAKIKDFCEKAERQKMAHFSFSLSSSSSSSD